MTFVGTSSIDIELREDAGECSVLFRGDVEARDHGVHTCFARLGRHLLIVLRRLMVLSIKESEGRTPG